MGWHTQSSPFVTHHHRPMGAGTGNSRLSASYRLGQRNLSADGIRPGRSSVLYQMTRAYLVGGAALLLGYGSAMLRREERPIRKNSSTFSGATRWLACANFLTGLEPNPK
jgi:hypothetical protein